MKFNNIDFTYNFLFSKDKKGSYNYIISINKDGYCNPLYGKELYIPKTDGDKDVLFQSLGYIGCFANNHYDRTIDYVVMPNDTLDKLQFGIKDELVFWIEEVCKEQVKNSKDPKKWRFNMKFIFEKEVIDYVRYRGEHTEEDCIIDLITKY